MSRQQGEQRAGARDRDAGPPAHRTESQSAYWREHYQDASWYRAGTPYAHYEDALRTGIEGQAEQGGRFEDAEVRLRSNYATRPGSQLLGWDQGAGLACRAAWQYAERWREGDSDEAAR
ncbi:MAG TPA: hypothetical protein VFG18_05700 [Xanthomonadaceae bacterium]|jgi:hypothetical protein|nr:hypothetical protein [Xanthomonadaceae bacterium]